MVDYSTPLGWSDLFMWSVLIAWSAECILIDLAVSVCQPLDMWGLGKSTCD